MDAYGIGTCHTSGKIERDDWPTISTDVSEDLMATISLREAQDKLPELIHQLSPGEELVITENDQPVARILPTSVAHRERQLGTMRGTVLHMAPDFDAPLDAFGEYMQ